MCLGALPESKLMSLVDLTYGAPSGLAMRLHTCQYVVSLMMGMLKCNIMRLKYSQLHCTPFHLMTYFLALS